MNVTPGTTSHSLSTTSSRPSRSSVPRWILGWTWIHPLSLHPTPRALSRHDTLAYNGRERDVGPLTHAGGGHTMERMPTAIIGCGGMGRRHLTELADPLARCRLAGPPAWPRSAR